MFLKQTIFDPSHERVCFPIDRWTLRDDFDPVSSAEEEEGEVTGQQLEQQQDGGGGSSGGSSGGGGGGGGSGGGGTSSISRRRRVAEVLVIAGFGFGLVSFCWLWPQDWYTGLSVLFYSTSLPFTVLLFRNVRWGIVRLVAGQIPCVIMVFMLARIIAVDAFYHFVDSWPVALAFGLAKLAPFFFILWVDAICDRHRLFSLAFTFAYVCVLVACMFQSALYVKDKTIAKFNMSTVFGHHDQRQVLLTARGQESGSYEVIAALSLTILKRAWSDRHGGARRVAFPVTVVTLLSEVDSLLAGEVQ